MVSKVPHRREKETEKHLSSQMPYTRPCTTSTNIPFARTQSLGPHLTVRMLEKAVFCVPRKSSVLRAQPHVGHPYFGESSGQPAAFSMEVFCLFTEHPIVHGGLPVSLCSSPMEPTGGQDLKPVCLALPAFSLQGSENLGRQCGRSSTPSDEWGLESVD